VFHVGARDSVIGSQRPHGITEFLKEIGISPRHFTRKLYRSIVEVDILLCRGFKSARMGVYLGKHPDVKKLEKPFSERLRLAG
jgi:hypothetical protein